MRPDERGAALEAALQQVFAPQFLRVRDDSRHHAGHVSAGGAGHFYVCIVSERFAGMSRLARHRAVFAAVDALMGAEVHALSIDAKTVEEVNAHG